MKKSLIIALLLMTLFISLPAAANISLWGPSGLIMIPSADVQGHNTLRLGYYYKGGNEQFGDVVNNAILFNYGFNEKIEAGLAYMPPASVSDIKVHLKVRLMEEGTGDYQPALAFGLIGQNAYVVASKNIGSMLSGLRAHLGYGLNDFRGIFAGVEKTLNGFSITEKDFHIPLTTLMAEFGAGTLNFGVNFEIIPQMKVKIGLANFKNFLLGAEGSYSF